mgnify:CR=1 FL=1
MPEGWAWERLTNLATFSGGKTPSTSKPEYWDGNVLWVTSKDMKKKYITTSQLQLSALGAEQMQLYYPDTLLLVTRSGILRHTLPVSILKECATINQDLKAIVLYMPQLAEYIYVCLKGMEEKILLKYTKSGTTVENVNFSEFQKILLPIAPIQEINRIITSTIKAEHIISYIGKEKTLLTECITKAKAKILDLAIRGKLVPQNSDDEPASVLLEHIRAEKEELIKQGKIKRDKKESIIFKGEDNSYYEKLPDGKENCIDEQLPFELPDGWKWCNLSMIGTTNIGLTYRPADVDTQGIIVLRSCNIVNDEINLTDLVRVKTSIRENQFVQKDDILICARNGSRSLVGKCALIPEFDEKVSFGAFMAVYRTPYFNYIVHFLRSNFFRSVFDDSNSTAINQLTQDMLKRAVVPFPPLAEQLRIVDKTTEFFERLNCIEESLN